MFSRLRALFIVTSSDEGTWLWEVTHPFWHLAERDVEVDFANPLGGQIHWTPRIDPYFEHSQEPNDLVSKGILSDQALRATLGSTARIGDVDIERYDAIHVAGGRGATFDLFPNPQLAAAVEYFWAQKKEVGALCHGAIALANNPERMRKRGVTAFSLDEDRELQSLYGSEFAIPNYPQTTLEKVGTRHTSADLHQPMWSWMEI
jgi:putative intracellular protease/amidase